MSGLILPNWMDWALRLPAWTPASIPGLLTWLEGRDVPAVLTPAAQPTLSGWAGANWVGSSLGPYTHTAGATTSLDSVATLIVGNQYTTIFTVSGRTAGTVTVYHGTTAGTARSGNGTFTDSLSCAGNTTHGFVPSSDFDGVVTVLTVSNDARTRWTPTSGSLGGYLSQASAALQPWWDGSGVRFDGDVLVSNLSAASWNPLHTSGTLFTMWIPHALGVSRDTVMTSAGAGNGLYSQQRAGDTVRQYVFAGGAVAAQVEPANTLTLGTPSIHVVRVAPAKVDAWLDGGSPSTATPSAALGGNADFSLQIGYGAGVADQTHLGLVAYDRALSDAEVAKVGQYLAAKYGATWS